MKSLSQHITESLGNFDRELKKLGFSKEQEGREIWYECKYKGKLIRVVQEIVGKNDWWLVKVESDYLMTDNDKEMTFESPLEAAKEAIDQIDENIV